MGHRRRSNADDRPMTTLITRRRFQLTGHDAAIGQSGGFSRSRSRFRVVRRTYTAKSIPHSPISRTATSVVPSAWKEVDREIASAQVEAS